MWGRMLASDMRTARLAASVVVTFSVLGSSCTPGEQATRNPPKPEPIEPPGPIVNPPPPQDSAADSGEPDTAVRTTGLQPIPDEGGATDGGQDPPPDAEPVFADPRIVVQDNGDGSCTKYYKYACPDGVDCKTRAPETMPCTDDIWPKAKVVANVTKRENGSCFEHAVMHCPEGATCNPPPPHRVSCASAGK